MEACGHARGRRLDCLELTALVRARVRGGERGLRSSRGRAGRARVPRARACDPIPHITLRSTVDRALYTDVRPTLTACRQKPGRGRGAGDRNVSGPRKGTGPRAVLSACRTLGSRPPARSSGIRCVGGRSGELRGTTGPKRGETSMSGLSRLPPPPVISGGNSEAADTSQRWSGGRPFTGVSRGTLQRCARSCSASRA